MFTALASLSDGVHRHNSVSPTGSPHLSLPENNPLDPWARFPRIHIAGHIERVDARSSVEVVGTVAPIESVVSITAIEEVITATPDEAVVARFSIEGVLAAPTDQRVVPIAAVDQRFQVDVTVDGDLVVTVSGVDNDL